MRIWNRSQLPANWVKSCEEGLPAGLQVPRRYNLIVPDYFVLDYGMGVVSFRVQTWYGCAGAFWLLFAWVCCPAGRWWQLMNYGRLPKGRVVFTN